MPTYLSFAERFWSKVNVVNDDECWDWLGAKIQTGYGQLTIAKHESRKEALAHRISWVLSFGAIHGKLEVGHKCANRKCVNPAHLYLTTRLENNREVKFRGEYNYPNQVNPEDLSYALANARYIKSLWEIRNFEFTNLSPDKIIQIIGIIQDKKVNQVIPVINYKPPKLSIMPCGHDEKYAVHEEEGTSWCVMCEYKATSEIIEKLRNTLQLNDELNEDLHKSSPVGNRGVKTRYKRISESPPAAYVL